MASFTGLIIPLIILSLSAKPTNSVSLSDQSFSIFLDSTPFNFTPSISLSCQFMFEIRHGFALAIVPAKFPSDFVTNMSFGLINNATRFLAIEFYPNVCNITSNVVTNNFVTNVSKVDNVLKKGVNLTSWIDYYPVTKRLEVSVSELSDPKPVEPLISYHVDLGEFFKGEVVLKGVASDIENHEPSVYSWDYMVEDYAGNWWFAVSVAHMYRYSAVKIAKEKGGVVNVIKWLAFATGCGALVALVMLFAWWYVVDWKEVRGGGSVHPVDLKYGEFDVLEVKDWEIAMK